MNEESIRARIRALLDEIQNEADPVLLNRCRSLFRREVSFFRRSYMAAYLLLLAEGEPVRSGSGRAGKSGRSGKFDRSGGRPDKSGRPGRSDDRSGDKGDTFGKPGRSGDRPDRSGGRPGGKPQRSGSFLSGGREERRRDREDKREEGRDRTRAETPSFSEEESARLFVSIGRNRRVFARDILALINARAGVDRDDVGTIRILDNYSFIQVRTSAADAIIGALNGQPFRGRTLTVNYARGRGEGEDPAAADGPDPDRPEPPETYAAEAPADYPADQHDPDGPDTEDGANG